MFEKSITILLVLIILTSLSACKKKNVVTQNSSFDGSSSGNQSNLPEDQSVLSGSGAKNTIKTDGGVIDITEKMYVTYINEIYTNTKDYIGKNIKLEGMFTAEYYEETKKTYYYVYRTGPGCCGNDGSMCGFEFTFGGTIPKENDWIEVVGKLQTYEEDGISYITLVVSSLKVLSKRGAETVYR